MELNIVIYILISELTKLFLPFAYASENSMSWPDGIHAVHVSSAQMYMFRFYTSIGETGL